MARDGGAVGVRERDGDICNGAGSWKLAAAGRIWTAEEKAQVRSALCRAGAGRGRLTLLWSGGARSGQVPCGSAEGEGADSRRIGCAGLGALRELAGEGACGESGILQCCEVCSSTAAKQEKG